MQWKTTKTGNGRTLGLHWPSQDRALKYPSVGPAANRPSDGKSLINLSLRCTRGLSLLVCILAIAALALLAGCGGSNDSANKDQVAGGPAAQFVHDSGQAEIQSMARGKAVACSSNLANVRSFINIYKDGNDGHLPASLANLDPGARAVSVCPSNNQPYTYDPATGIVKCTTPGHEKL